MKRIITVLALFLIILNQNIYPNGVLVVNASTNNFLKLKNSSINVTVNNQIATVITKQTFVNSTAAAVMVKYAFPMPENASATGLRWYKNGSWYTASFDASEQDTTLPGSSGNSTVTNLARYLGPNPLFFEIKDAIDRDSAITIELTYVELLPYKLNKVTFFYPNDYSLIQTDNLDKEELNFNLTSVRIIDSINFNSAPATINKSASAATVNYSATDIQAKTSFIITYQLASTTMGLYSFSTLLPDSLTKCDKKGNGYFSLIIEPQSDDNATVINKNFILVIDRSGSMSGSKVEQAKSAASQIVKNLNEGDKFNLIDFDDIITPFETGLVNFNITTQNKALSYISGLTARGSTNIAQSLSTAISMFASNDTNSANIIIFFTDGQPTAGVTSTDGILDAVKNTVASKKTKIYLYTFGIGGDANQELLTLLAGRNNGLADFLGSNELEQKLTDFYNTIRNPVLINTSVTFDPPVAKEIYPNPQPNIYKGMQMMIVGRYDSANAVKITLSGETYGKVSYTYNFNLADSQNVNYQFLPKIWAKKKIEYLTYKYYTSFKSDTALAASVRKEAEDLSICYQVMSKFTSFTDNNDYWGSGYYGYSGYYLKETPATINDIKSITPYPNPFTSQVVFSFENLSGSSEPVILKIFDMSGKLVKTIVMYCHENCTITWDGRLENNMPAESGTYFYVLNAGNETFRGKIYKE